MLTFIPHVCSIDRTHSTKNSLYFCDVVEDFISLSIILLKRLHFHRSVDYHLRLLFSRHLIQQFSFFLCFVSLHDNVMSYGYRIVAIDLFSLSCKNTFIMLYHVDNFIFYNRMRNHPQFSFQAPCPCPLLFSPTGFFIEKYYFNTYFMSLDVNILCWLTFKKNGNAVFLFPDVKFISSGKKMSRLKYLSFFFGQQS